MIDSWDYEYTDRITCPYCGYKFTDSWDYGVEEGNLLEVDCEDCERSFEVTCYVSVKYISKLPGELTADEIDNPPPSTEKK